MANWVKQVLLLLAGLALLVGLIWLLVVLRPLLVALTVAALLAYLLNPAVVWLEKRVGGKRPLAATLVYILLLALLAGPLALLILTLIERWSLVQEELQEALFVMQGWFSRPLPLFGFVLYPESLLENLRIALGNALSSLTLGGGGLLSGLMQNLLWSLVVLVSLYYLLRDGHHLKPWLLTQIPAPRQADAQQLVAEIDAVWGLFLRVQLFIFAVLAILIGSGTVLILWLFRQGWLPLSSIGLALLLVAMYTAIQQSVHTYLSIPIGVNELVFAGWLIVKGFNPSAVFALSARQPELEA